MDFKPLLGLLLVAALCPGQVNQWRQITGMLGGVRHHTVFTFCPDSNRFLMTMGRMMGDSTPYTEMMLNPVRNGWVNFLPHDTLYGKWVDSTGKMRMSGFPAPLFGFSRIEGYLRPFLGQNEGTGSQAYFQHAYASDNGKIYYYIQGRTFSYDTRLRRWDTLSVPLHPSNFQGGDAPLIWGAMCYDPVNQEVLLFGGGGVDAENGNVGTWVFKPSNNAWSRLDLDMQPPPRCLSPMAYDAANQKIILFGGDRLDALYADTWVYDCATRTWAQKHPVLSPKPRFGHALLYLPKSRKIVLVGGSEYTSSTAYFGAQYRQISPMEMWTYDVVADEWKLVKSFSTADTIPLLSVQGAEAAIMAADTGDGIIAAGFNYCSGYTPAFATFLLNCDPGQTDEAGTLAKGVPQGVLEKRTGPFDPAWYDSAVPPSNPDSMEALLRNLPADTWTRLYQPRVPRLDRIWGTRVYDADHDQILVWGGGHSSHCGTDVPQYCPATNRWRMAEAGEWPLERTFSNTSYPPYFTFQNRPFMTVHTYDNYAYDPLLKRMLLVKGKYTYPYDPVKMDWDSARIMNHPLMGGRCGTISMTATARGAVCWTMTADIYSREYLCFLLDTAGRAWKRLPVTGGTLPIYRTEAAGAAYDSKRDQMVFMSRITEAGKVWIYDFTDSILTAITPPGPVPSGILRECVYLPNLDKIIYAGNESLGVFNCGTRSFESLPVYKGAGVGTTNDESSGYMVDPARGLIWDVQANCEVYVMRVSGGAGSDGGRGVLRYAPTAAVPNPFNPDVRIVLPENIRKSIGWTLTIFSPDGKIVRTLGRSLAWNGKNDAGLPAPSGIYYCVLNSGQARQTIRLTLLK